MANTFHVLPSHIIPDLGGLASFNLNLACAYYILISQSQQYDEKTNTKNNKNNSINFGMLPNQKKTI